MIKAVDRVAETILFAALIGELVIVTVNVLGRSFGQTGFLWTPEISQIA
ncbi:MAG: hypothetical protein ACREML_04205 [Vulcanimicrobiaceae bacterium]